MERNEAATTPWGRHEYLVSWYKIYNEDILVRVCYGETFHSQAMFSLACSS
jgi:hypothetical protein